MAHVNRRQFIGALGALSLPAWFPRMSFAAAESAGDILVCVFLRGGADGLNMVVPYSESLYYQNRKSIAIAQPGKNNGAVDLDGSFGLHPALAPLRELYDDGLFAPVIAAGLVHDTHSHFDAMEFMESGLPGSKHSTSGWIGRHLESRGDDNTSPFRAISLGWDVPTSLRGPIPATALSSIEEFHFDSYEGRARNFQQTLIQMYNGDGLADVAALQTVNALNTLSQANVGDIKPDNGAKYDDDDYFALGLREIAKIIKADIGLEVACIDLGDWDTHEGQGGVNGWMAGNLRYLANGLHAFVTDLGSRMERVTIVVMSEFGRRIDENASGGTDHGHGNLMLALGGGIHGGMVHGDWPGLHPDQLYGPGDLDITTDYRTILAEILEMRLGNSNIGKVFPGYTQKAYRGIAQ